MVALVAGIAVLHGRNPGSTSPTTADPAVLAEVEAADYYTIERDKIPSIKFALGQTLTVTNFTQEDGLQTIDYSVPKGTARDDIDRYVAFLKQHGCPFVYDHSTTAVGAIDVGCTSVSGGIITVSTASFTDALMISLFRSSSASSPPATTTPSPSPSRNGTSAPSVDPAPGWTGSSAILGLSKGDATLRIVTTYSSLTHEAYAELLATTLKDIEPTADVSDVTQTTVSGLEAWRFTATFAGYVALNVSVFNGSTVHSIVCRAPIDQYDALTPDFQAMIDSFQLPG